MSAPRGTGPAHAPYAVYSCSRETVSYWEDLAKAQACARFLDQTGCGSRCRGRHAAVYRDPRGRPRPPDACAMLGCRRRRHARGWCKKHYMRWWHHWRRRHRLGPLPTRPVPSPVQLAAEMRAAHAELARVVGA